jgi:hypothetical protein
LKDAVVVNRQRLEALHGAETLAAHQTVSLFEKG